MTNQLANTVVETNRLLEKSFRWPTSSGLEECRSLHILDKKKRKKGAED